MVSTCLSKTGSPATLSRSFFFIKNSIRLSKRCYLIIATVKIKNDIRSSKYHYLNIELPFDTESGCVRFITLKTRMLISIMSRLRHH